jgi:hypothetical protein
VFGQAAAAFEDLSACALQPSPCTPLLSLRTIQLEEVQLELQLAEHEEVRRQ